MGTRRGGSNEYPQSMFWSKNKKNRYTPAYPRFAIYTEQKKKRNNRPPRIFEFKGKTLIISGLLLYDSHSWDIRVYHARN